MASGKRTGGAWDPVYRLVRRIPRGRVMTYGQIAEMTPGRLSARAVGWAMNQCPDGVPWQRVVNRHGRCSTDDRPDVPPGLQRALLEAEGVEFDDDGRIELERYRYRPRLRPATRTSRGRSAASRP